MDTALDFVKNADNVYRTKEFIVKQRVGLCKGANGTPLMMSEDTYYKRTPKRDFAYEVIFKTRGPLLEGKRIISAVYTRKYID